MLQQALGGNSSTIMICAIRPGHLYYEETLNTLKYADRAKKIKNTPKVNEDENARMIRELKEENEKLKAQLAAGGGGGGGGGADPEEMKRLKEELEANMAYIKNQSQSWEEQLAAAKAEQAEEERKEKEKQEAIVSGRPQLLNLNEDGLLDRKIFIDLSKQNKASVGRKQIDASQNPDIVLGGIGIQSQHCIFETDDNKTQIKPLNDAAVNQIWVNGEKLTSQSPYTLKPNDRVIFGTGSVFLFRNQLRDAESGPRVDSPEDPITYEFAMSEKMANEEKEQMARAEEEKKKAEEEAAAKMAELQA